MVVVDPEDYPELLAKLQGEGGECTFRRKLAWKAFQHVSSYDSAVAEWLWKHQREDGMLSHDLFSVAGCGPGMCVCVCVYTRTH